MRSLLKFFSLTYLVSWAFFAAAAAVAGGSTSPPADLAVLRDLLFLLGTITPALVALALTERADGRVGTLVLLRRIAEWPSGVRWYVFAVSYMAVVKLGVALVYRLLTGVWPPFGQEAVYLMAVVTVISTPVQAGEEIGWRGYALPRLASRFGLARASIALGMIWATWHLPLFLIPGVDKFGQSFPMYLLQVIALSVALAWLYWRTRGSLLLVMLMHAAINNTAGIVPSAALAAASPFTLNASPVAWLTVALLWVGAVYFLIQMRAAKLPLDRPAVTEMRDESSVRAV